MNPELSDKIIDYLWQLKANHQKTAGVSVLEIRRNIDPRKYDVTHYNQILYDMLKKSIVEKCDPLKGKKPYWRIL